MSLAMVTAPTITKVIPVQKLHSMTHYTCMRIVRVTATQEFNKSEYMHAVSPSATKTRSNVVRVTHLNMRKGAIL